ncbi:MAG TPA: SLC13 family permease [Candidatus Atribacteria bacterium]|nr:SLC13 family permease [Candidatus Atribacteria bacterium]
MRLSARLIGIAKNIVHTLKKDIVLSAALTLAAISCIFARPRLEYINFSVLSSLFCLMIVVKAFEELRILDGLAVFILTRCRDSRRVSLVLILLSFFASMLITNDVALITLVPLALIIGRKTGMNVMETVILQTLAANIGSSLTPMGNPQNLYIFARYGLSAGEFFPVVGLLAALGLIWLPVLNLRTGKAAISLDFERVSTGSMNKTAVWTAVLLLVVMSIFELVDYRIALAATLAVTVCLNRRLLSKADYALLVTFVCFFIFIGNVSSIPAVKGFMESSLSSRASVYFGSIVISQAISNVPAAIFLSSFTGHWRELLLGVNIGGMGTIIASLASVISYKLYLKENPAEGKRYLAGFSAYNFLSLFVFALLMYFAVVL